MSVMAWGLFEEARYVFFDNETIRKSRGIPFPGDGPDT